MKALKTKVILSGIVLVFAFIATIGTTFAWFTVSQTATVDTMTLNVTSAEGLGIIPVDATNFADPTTGYINDGSGANNDLGTAANYEPLIEVSDLFGASYNIGPTAVDGWRVSPATVVTTAYDGYDLKDLNYLSDLAARTLASATANNADGNYLELKFWVYLQGEEDEEFSLELIDTSSITSTAGNTTNQSDISDSLRMVVWADDTDYGTAGTEGDALIFGNSVDYDYIFSGDFATGNNTLSSNEAVAGDLDDLTNTPLTSTTDHFDLVTYTGNGNPTDIFTITTNTPTLVTVLIFVEGWDQEATNNISLAQFDIKFGFQIGTTD